jgi:hypothetical protein
MERAFTMSVLGKNIIYLFTLYKNRYEKEDEQTERWMVSECPESV